MAHSATSSPERQPEPGTVFRSLDPKLVLEVVVSTSEWKLFAYRQRPEDSFQIVFARRQTRDAERCLSRPDFMRFLEAVTSLPVIDEVRQPVNPVSEGWVLVELWDGSGRTGDETRLRRPDSVNQRTILQFGFDQYTVDLDGTLWNSVRAGCAGLGAPS